MVKVKIVILNWNGREHLKRFLPSVVRTTPSDVGIVVADNGSTDDSVEMLRREFPEVEVLLMDRNYGFAGGYNRCLKEIEADYYVLINSDIETPQGWLEPLIETLEREEDVAVVAPKLRAVCAPEKFEYAGAAGGYIDYLGYPFCRGRILKNTERDEGQYDDERDVFWVSGAAFCCRSRVFHELGGFDADFFAHMEEIDLCWRMQLAGYRVKIQPRSVVFHLGGGTLAVDSPRKVFFNHRNNLAMLFKCAPTGQRILVAVVRPLLDLLAACSYLAQGQGRNFLAVFRAYRDFIVWHKALYHKRKAIQRNRKGSAKQTIYHGSILLRFVLGKKHFENLL